MKYPGKQYDIQELLIRLLEDDLNDSQRAQLLEWSRSNSKATQEYCDFIKDYAVVSNVISAQIEPKYGCSEDTTFDKALWNALLEEQGTAPGIQIPKEKPERELIQKVIYPPRQKRQISKFNLMFLMINAAAILFFMLFVRIVPPRKDVQVATLSDSINAKWADISSSINIGSRLVDSGERLILKEGLVELTFDNKTKTVFEAPAEFQILADDRIGLSYGKVYAKVPPDAVGFSAYTPNAKVIDLGTEFGLEVDSNGNTQLSVLKGKTLLVAGKNDKTKMEVTEGIGKKVSGKTEEIYDMDCISNVFVRKIESETNIVWRGQTIDLGDVVRNGYGLGTGNSEIRLNYKKGFTTDFRGGETLTSKDYLLIENHPFIDGIFIPNGKTIVDSQGDVFEDFLWTDGVYSADLLGSPDPGFFIINGQSRVIQFDGQEYSDQGKSCIVMLNSNHGITFDLDAIRSYYNLRIDCFQAQVGLADLEDKRCNANFYVLVDGQLRYSLLEYTQKGILNDVLVKLKETDRFLTLATSENVDQIDYMANSTLNNNWCVFAEPVLVLE